MEIFNYFKKKKKNFTGIAKEMKKITLETAKILQDLHEMIKKESQQIYKQK